MYSYDYFHSLDCRQNNEKIININDSQHRVFNRATCFDLTNSSL